MSRYTFDMKPALAKGTRDFSPEEIIRREYIIDIIKQSFVRYGFAPIETPSFERSDTLLGKYGEEGDRLIFKILNSGDFLRKVPQGLWEDRQSNKWGKYLSEKALRYDLTVPFARYVVMHRNDIHLPFKRYQIQPVWRADRPQKGRYREFYQCDADVVGSRSLWQDVEFVQLYDEVFTKLGIPQVTIKLNNRKILAGIAEVIGEKDKLVDITVALDKLDKIGEEKVMEEMRDKNIPADAVEKLRPLFGLTGTAIEKIKQLRDFLSGSETGMKGLEELSFVVEKVASVGLKSSELEVDMTLARGLNYYTGSIMEVVTGAAEVGSIGGGGRYDDLTGIFGWKDLSGIGISFGLERIYLVMEKTGAFDHLQSPRPDVMFVHFGDQECEYSLPLIQKLRDKGFSVVLYPDAAKMNKQMKYANQTGIPYVVIAGEEEMQNNTVTVKNMNTSGQKTVGIDELPEVLGNE